MSSTSNTAPPPYSAASEHGYHHLHHHNGNDSNSQPRDHPHHHQQPITNPNATTYHLRNHISSLSTRIRDSNIAHANNHATADSALLETVLVPHIEAFLAELGTLPEHPPSATLVLYPAAAMLDASLDSQQQQMVQRVSKLSGLDDMQRHGEFVRVHGVEGLSPSSKLEDVKADFKSNYTFSDGGGATKDNDMLWWKDEPMAKRLASYLQPKPEEDPNMAPPAFFDADVARHEQQQQHEQQMTKKRSWGLKKFVTSRSRSSALGTRPPKPVVQGRGYAVQSVNASELDTRARMMVQAEEMSFRVENDMGLYESFNGWALVARVDFATH